MKPQLVLIFALISNALFVCAQPVLLKKLKFQSITIGDGLSQGMVNSMVQDQRGFLWFATKDGLNRYDGYHFKIYRHNPDNPFSISDSYVESLCEDAYGNIWVGTASGTLEVLDPATDRFKRIYPLQLDGKAGLPGAVKHMATTADGRVWAMYFDRVICISIARKQDGSIRCNLTNYPPPVISAHNVIFLTNKKQQVNFFNIVNAAVYRFDEATKCWIIKKNLGQFFKSQHIKHIRNILEDSSNGHLYILCESGIVEADQNNFAKMVARVGIYGVNRSIIDKQGSFFFNLDHGGIGIFNTRTKTLEFAEAEDENVKKSLAIANCILIDRSGIVWIGTKGYGIITLNNHSQRFHHIGNSSKYAFIQTANGKIWVQDSEENLREIDTGTGSFKDSVSITKTPVYFEEFSQYSYPQFVNTNNTIWFANLQKLSSYNLNTKAIHNYPLPIVWQPGAAYKIVTQINACDTNFIWVATTNGLLRLDVKTSSWKRFAHNPANKNSLSFNSLFSICFDPVEPEKYIWIGTGGAGINKMDMATGFCQRYNTKNGLPNDVVYGILPDNHKRLWISTNQGLSCFNLETQTFKNYEEKDGLQSNEFNHYAFLKAKDGTLFFGGVNGCNYFNPDEIATNSVIPQVAITELKIRNELVVAGEPNSPLAKAVFLSQSVTLPYEDNMIGFEFAALDFSAPAKNSYRYKLDGFDKGWINAGHANNATYTNLDPGKYTFIVKGSNKDDVWNETGASLHLTILPPWYLTLWFKLLVIAAITGSIYALYRYRLRQALKLLKMRNHIASDLHDEIGSNLSSIAIFSDVAGYETNGQPVSATIKKIGSYAQESMEAMDDIVWMINSSNDRFVNIVNRMEQRANELFNGLAIKLHFEVADNLRNMQFGMEQRKNFWLIYKEAINNAAKYSQAQDVWVFISAGQGFVKLVVEDNGIGFNTAAPRHGNGLKTMQERAAVLKGRLDIESDEGRGTKLQLDFAAS